MFVDIAKIKIKAGDGGAGAVAFHREKYVAAGGPDGGDGGKGGDVVFVVDDNLATLADFRYKRKYVAKNGENGRGSRQYGKKAPDLEIKVPRGTIIREANGNSIKLSDEGEWLINGAKGIAKIPHLSSFMGQHSFRYPYTSSSEICKARCSG